MTTINLELKTPGELLDEIVRLRAALEDIAYMDDFMNADSAKRMMEIARTALSSGK